MQFRLTYEGILLGSSRSTPRARHKHEIRRVFQKQLKRLQSYHPAFRSLRFNTPEELSQCDGSMRAVLEEFDKDHRKALDRFQRCGYKFFPLATRDLSLLCSVSILFLRPDIPGGVIRSGDIDNRMKTIFDALRMPSGKDELGGYEQPGDDEDPFVCLLEDDSLISQASIETDTLLQPTGESWEANDARLTITVRLTPFGNYVSNSSFA